MHRSVRVRIVAASAAVVGLSGVAVAVASPPSGLERVDVSRARIGEARTVELRPGGDVAVQKVTIAPGGSSGWHAHHDAGMVLVDKGTLTNYGLHGAPCEPVAVVAGQTYGFGADPEHAHLARNEGEEVLELTFVTFNVPPDQKPRIEAERPAECPADLN